MMRALILLAALSGCEMYAHRSMHNAPGLVDLDTPPGRERGEPNAFTSPSQPATETIAVFVMPEIVFGTGRLDTGQGAAETGVSFRVERVVDKNGALLHRQAFAITGGVGLAQFSENRPTMFGATYVEVNYRSFLGFLPVDLGAGAAVYPSVTVAAIGEHYDASVGGQLSLRFPLVHVRMRYIANSGFEIMGGYEIPIAFFFGRSR
ncbi:hypothetical protein BH11MYX3_BH11MYX3_40200 [soil metagenome]